MYKKTDHYDGNKFFNPWGANVNKSFTDLLRWKIKGNPKPWPPAFVKNQAHPDLSAPADGQVNITYIGHATLYIRSKQEGIITDPQFSLRCSPSQLIGPSRSRLPGAELTDLGSVDKVLVSHNHYDHMDLPSLVALHRTYNPTFIVPLGNGKYLRKQGINSVIELDWWETFENIRLVPAQHWSARGINDRNQALWGGFVVRVSGKQIFFAGDTGYGPHFRTIAEKLGPMDISLLPIGAYEPRWFMQDQHMNPNDAVKAHIDLRSKQSIAMHFETFRLTDEAFFDPRNDLTSALKMMEIANEQFFTPETGATLSFSATPLSSPKLSK